MAQQQRSTPVRSLTTRSHESTRQHDVHIWICPKKLQLRKVCYKYVSGQRLWSVKQCFQRSLHLHNSSLTQEAAAPPMPANAFTLLTAERTHRGRVLESAGRKKQILAPISILKNWTGFSVPQTNPFSTEMVQTTRGIQMAHPSWNPWVSNQTALHELLHWMRSLLRWWARSESSPSPNPLLHSSHLTEKS